MNKVNSFIAGLPAPVRHFCAVFAGAFFTVVIAGIVKTGTVLDLDWAALLDDAFIGALGTAAAAVGLLAITPATKSYGVGKEDPVKAQKPVKTHKPKEVVPDFPEVAPEPKPIPVKKTQPKPAPKKTPAKKTLPAKPVKGTVKKAAVKPRRIRVKTTKPYARIWYKGVQVDQRTKSALEWVELMCGVKFTLSQGSYNAGGVNASAGTHDGGGVVDIRVSDLTSAQRRRVVRWLKKAGFAAWYRNWAGNQHIHAVLLGHRNASPEAKAQMTSYRAHRDGLYYNNYDPTWRPNPIPRWNHRLDRPVKKRAA